MLDFYNCFSYYDDMPPYLTLNDCRAGDIIRAWDGSVCEVLSMSFMSAYIKPMPGDRREVATGTEVKQVIGHTNTVEANATAGNRTED